MRSLKLAKVNNAPRGNDVRRKVVVVTRLVSQRETLASRTVKLADPVPIVLMLASPKVIANQKRVAKVTDVRQKGDARPKEIDVVRVAMPLVARPMDAVRLTDNDVAQCRDSLNSSIAIMTAALAATNWIA